MPAALMIILPIAFFVAMFSGAKQGLANRPPEVRVEELAPLTKRVTVEGRSYLVLRLGGGRYMVVSVVDPSVSLLFDQTGPLNRAGPLTAHTQLDADMKVFPPALFSEAKAA